MIIKSINQSQFIDAFKALRPDNFSYNGLIALYDYFEEYTDDTQVDYELDVIALCCDYTEYATAYEAMEQYQPEDIPLVDNSEGMDLLEIQEATEKLCLEWLQDRTTVIEFDGGIIIQNF